MMSAPHGYHGRFLEIDVGKCSFAWREISSDTLRQYLGGVGLGTYLLNRLQDGCVDPLSPESILAFVFSPLVGSALTTSAKFAVVSKSPQTNRINDSLSSSRFAIAGKRTGADAIVLRGQSDQPIIVSIDDSSVQFLPAAAYWGMECSEAERRIRDDMPASDAQVAVIGPAGENLVKYATISNDGRHAGRGGHGAVMGSKNVKALVVRGQKCVTWAQPAQLNKLAKELSAKSFGPATAKYRELGTAANLLVFNRLAMLPTRNFQQGQLESA
ncbi:MAG: aldehyde ferredoxin oxidoreductase N-terminal domain-containing protein, partial [Pirellulaceae bacterium]